MNIIHCANCRHWDQERTVEGTKLRRCLHPKCDKESDDGFMVAEGEPYNAGAIATGPFFSCIHGEMARG